MLARFAICALGLATLVASAPPISTGDVPMRHSLDSLDVADGLHTTLVAEGPTLTNPTNIDVDARGRIWVLEGVNYRKFKPKPLRAEGDRIVILEDTTGDGVVSSRMTMRSPSARRGFGLNLR